MKREWEIVPLRKVLKQYRQEIWIDDAKEYSQLTNSKHKGIFLRGKKLGSEIGRKRQFVVNLEKHPATITYTRQTIQADEAIGICPPEVHGCIVTENMPLFSVTDAEPEFLKLFFKTEEFLKQLHSTSAVGTSQQSIHEDVFLNFLVPLPPKPEQQRIISKIEAVQQRLAQISELRAAQEKELKVLAFSIFSDVEQTAWSRAFGSFLVPTNNQFEPELGTQYRQVGVRWWGEGAYERETIDGGQTTYPLFTKLQEHDFIFNKIWVRHGALAVVKQDTVGCYASTEFPVYRFNHDEIHPRWLDFVIKLPLFWERCANLSQGTSGKNRIKPSEFLKMEIPVPSQNEQARLIPIIERIEAMQIGHRQTEEELRALLPSLLDKAFKGEL